MNSTKEISIIPGAEPFRLKADGPKILLIHGFTASPTELRPIGDFLHSKGYDIFSVLLAGHGTAPEDLQSKKVSDWWNSVKKEFELIDQCDFVIGFSMGALLASRVAVEYKDKIKGVILISSFMRIKPKILSKVAFTFPILKYIKPYFNKSPETEQYFKKHNLISYMKYPMSAVHEAVKLSNYTQKKILQKITVPTLIIQGVKDDRIDPEGYKILEKRIPAHDKKVVLLPNSHHIVTVGPDTKLLFESIHQFLKEHQ